MKFNLDFLRDGKKEKEVASKAFHFLSNPLNTIEAEANVPIAAVKKVTGKTLPNPITYAKEAGQQAARVPETIARSAVELETGGARKKITGSKDFSSSAVADPLRKILYGTKDGEQVQTYQKRTEGNKKVLEGSRFKGVATPLSLLAAGLTVGGDVTGFGGAEEATAKKTVQEIAEAGTVQAVKKILGKNTPDHLAKSLAEAKDEHVIKNIIRGEGSQIPKEPEIDIPAPGKVEKPVEPKAPEPVVNPNIEDLERQIKTKKELLQHAPNDTAKAKINAQATALIKEKDDLIAKDFKINNPDGANAEGLKINNPDDARMGLDVSNPLGASTTKPLQISDPGGARPIKVSDPMNTRPIPVNNPDGAIATKLSGAAEQAHLGKEAPADLKEASIPKTKDRKFLQTSQKSEIMAPESKDAVGAIEPKQYTQKSNKTLVSKSQEMDDTARAAKREELLSKEHYTDQDVSDAGELVRRANNELEEARKAGDTATVAAKAEESARLVDVLDQKLRASGRTVQAANTWGRLTPEGILKLAQRKIRAAREGAKHGDAVAKEGATAKKIQKTLDSTAPDKKMIDGVVKDIVDNTEDTSTGQKIAKKIENTVDPKQKKKADTLVAEITKKIKQEQMTPLPAKSKKSPTDVLREVFGRNKEAQEAFPEAQKILREKFADNPKALATLDKFFTSELGLPAASKTIDNAVREQLAKSGTKVSDIIYKSLAEQKTTVDDISKALVNEGFDEESAKTLATQVHGRLTAQVHNAKIKALERLSKDAPKAAKDTYADKLNKYSNLGALDDQDYLDLARGKLKLPQLTPKISEELSVLAQKMQGLADDDPERYRVLQQIGEKMAEAVPMTGKEKLYSAAGAPRSLLASTDISGMGRQGSFLGTRFPKEFKNAFKDQVKFVGSPEGFKQTMAEIQADPLYKLADKAGIALTGITKNPEEVFTSTALESNLFKKVGIGHVVEASDRAYTGSLTKFRFDTFKHIMNDLPNKGADLSEKELQSLGHYINVSTGRGGKAGGYLSKHGDTLGQALFSPQLWASRLKVLSPKYYYDLKGPARKLALENAGSFAAVAGTVFGLATLLGAKVETDARSSDFLKIRVGDTRYDLLGGFQQNLVFAHRELTGEKKNSMTGQVTKLGTEYGGADRLTILSDLVQNKENPLIATGSRLLKGKDRAGNPTNLKNEAVGLVTPLSIQDTASQIQHKGVAKGVAGSIPGFLGAGTQTYGTKDLAVSGKQKEYLTKLEKSGASKEHQEAAKSFFQQVKSAPSRDMAADPIKEALKAGDSEKAKKLAKEYNEKYAASFKPWIDSNPKYKSDKALMKEYNSNKITSESLKRWLATIKEENKGL